MRFSRVFRDRTQHFRVHHHHMPFEKAVPFALPHALRNFSSSAIARVAKYYGRFCAPGTKSLNRSLSGAGLGGKVSADNFGAGTNATVGGRARSIHARFSYAIPGFRGAFDCPTGSAVSGDP